MKVVGALEETTKLDLSSQLFSRAGIILHQLRTFIWAGSRKLTEARWTKGDRRGDINVHYGKVNNLNKEPPFLRNFSL